MSAFECQSKIYRFYSILFYTFSKKTEQKSDRLVEAILSEGNVFLGKVSAIHQYSSNVSAKHENDSNSHSAQAIETDSIQVPENDLYKGNQGNSYGYNQNHAMKIGHLTCILIRNI